MGRFTAMFVLLAACTDPLGPGEEGDGDRASSASPCEQVREHLIDLRLATATTLAPADVAQHRAAMRQAMGTEFLETCTSERRTEQIQCALDARDLPSAATCMTPMGRTTN
jgi:hypothetical protein